MKKKLFSFIMAAAMALSLPAAAFASDTLVDANGQPVSNDVFDDGWEKAAPADLMEFAAMEALATVDEGVVTEEEYGDDSDLMGVKVSSSSVGRSRISSTKGKVSAYGAFNKKASIAKCAITIQVKSNGSWKVASNLPVYGYVKTVYNANSITASKYFSLKSGKVYRAKIVFTDKNSSGSYTKISYTGSF